MELLLDTCSLLWALFDDNKLSKQARDLLANEDNDVYVSAASLWEIAIKNLKHPDLMPYSLDDVYNIIICELYTFHYDGMPEFANAFVSEQTVFLNYSIKYNDNTDLIDMRAYYLLQFIRIAKTDCLDNITINWSYYAE